MQAVTAGQPICPVVLNTPFTILTSLGKPPIEERRYMTDAEADRLWPVVHHYGDTTADHWYPTERGAHHPRELQCQLQQARYRARHQATCPSSIR